jgi:hypothetical protein
MITGMYNSAASPVLYMLHYLFNLNNLLIIKYLSKCYALQRNFKFGRDLTRV